MDSDGIDDDEDLTKPDFSIAIVHEADDDSSLQRRPPQLSTPVEDGDQTGMSVEIARRARRAIDEQPLEMLSRQSFESVQKSDLFDHPNEQDFNGVLQPTGGDSPLQPSVGIHEGELEEFVIRSEIGLVISHKDERSHVNLV